MRVEAAAVHRHVDAGRQHLHERQGAAEVEQPVRTAEGERHHRAGEHDRLVEAGVGEAARRLDHRVGAVRDDDPRRVALAAVLEDQRAVGVGHLERSIIISVRIDTGTRQRPSAQHLGQVRVLEVEPAVDLVVLLVEGAAGDEDANFVRGHAAYSMSRGRGFCRRPAATEVRNCRLAWRRTADGCSGDRPTRVPARILPGDCHGRRIRRQVLGLDGEDAAVRDLEARGYDIVARRYRTRLGELDVVARDGPVLVFVEVKTRSTPAFGDGLEAITADKRRRLVRMAHEYLWRNGLDDAPCRFDVVAIDVAQGGDAGSTCPTRSCGGSDVRRGCGVSAAKGE